MPDHPLEQLGPQVSEVRIKKRDKLQNFLGISKPKSKDVKFKASSQSLHSRPLSQQSTRPPSIVSQVSNHPQETAQTVINPTTEEEKPKPAPLDLAQATMDIFPNNIAKSVITTELPRIQERIESTKQLIYCNILLLRDSSHSPVAVVGEGLDDGATITLREPTLDKAELDWLEEVKKDPMEQDHLRWLVTRMVEAFVAVTIKNSTEIAEIVALGPVLPREPYRKLLLSLIKDFDEARILDVNILRGLVELVQAASTDFLEADDLVKILSILRVSLQGTHQQSTTYSYHLTLAVSEVLDVMAEHKVQDLDRVLEYEPFSGVLSGLKDSSDPYLMYQACYAFQALQYVPDDESALQSILRHSIGVADSLVKISAVFKLDLASVLEGLGSLQESLSGFVGVAADVYEGVSSLMESGREVFDSLKEGLSTGQKRPWYPAIKAAYAFVKAGQLKDLKLLIFEAPCRRDPLFQWGIFQMLGEIALDPVWADATRQQAVGLLGHLYKDDQDWGRDESVKAWMLTVIAKLGTISDQVVNTVANGLLQDLEQNTSTLIQQPYPLTTRLPIPASSPVLTKVHSIPSVEYDLHRLRLQRLKEAHMQVYIPPMAKANLQACDDDLFPLLEKVEEFLASDRQVMLILGDSGAGKSTFNKHFELALLQSYTRGGRIPLFINLPAIERPEKELITEQLRTYNFSESQIQELKQHRQFIVICDGYDESQLTANLHTSNLLNRPDQWDVKLVISCRSQYLSQDYRDRFVPHGGGHYNRPALDLFQEAAISPFSKEQIQDYVAQYVPPEPRTWTTQDYMDKLTTIPNLMDLVKNPFLLTLALEALPKVTDGQLDLSVIKITRVQLYDTFVDHWLDVNKRCLQCNVLSKEDQATLDELVEAGFVSVGVDYSTRLATAIFEQQEGNPIVQYVHRNDKKSWKAAFFGPDPEIRLLRESSPLTRTGSLFRFLHRSMLEYFLSRAVFDPSSLGDISEFSPQLDPRFKTTPSLDPHGPLFKRDLLVEPSVIQFLCERVKENAYFEQQLLVIIEQSKTDSAAATAAANAITILVQAGVRFNGADLRGIRISGADLSGGQFDCAQLQGADLMGVNFAGSWLRKVDFGAAQMDGVRFGELPYLKETAMVAVCSYSPDGSLLAVGVGQGTYGFITTYNTTTWTKRHQHFVGSTWINGVTFSPSNHIIAVGTSDKTVRLWDITSEDAALVMEGHSKSVYSVAFSPCGKQVASGSGDNTVRLWSSETGRTLFVLEGHKYGVFGVAFTPDGQRLVSADGGRTIRVWDSETGILAACWDIPFTYNSSVFMSADGERVAVTFLSRLKITNTVTKEPGLVLDIRSYIQLVAFSPNGQWFLTINNDNVIQLRDISTGLLISSFSGHVAQIYTCTISPDCSQIASGDTHGHVRLWDVDTSRAILNLAESNNRVSNVMYSHSGGHVISSGSKRGVQQWDSQSGAPKSFARKALGEVESLALLSKSEHVATGCADGTVRLWDPYTDSVQHTLLKHDGRVKKLAFSRCGRWVLCFCEYGAHIWDLDTNERLAEFYSGTHTHYLSMAFTPEGQFLLGSNQGLVVLYDPRAEASPKYVKKVFLDTSINSMECSPDGQELAIGTDANTVFLWDFQSESPGIMLHGHERGVSCVAYSLCGKRILSGSHDKSVRIWHSQASQGQTEWSCVAVVVGWSDSVSCLAWSPVDPMEFVTGCRDGSVRVWWISGGDDGRDVSVQMLWGTNIGRLSAFDLTFKGATGLSRRHQKLLIQNGAINASVVVPGRKHI